MVKYKFSFDVNILRLIENLAKSMSIVATALYFNEAPQSVAMTLSGVERWLKFKLFTRDEKKNLTGLTRAGKAYVEYASAILKAKDNFDQAMCQIRMKEDDNTQCHEADGARRLASEAVDSFWRI